jgi:DNA invertase Pin-like site-specific DNA recombinase
MKVAIYCRVSTMEQNLNNQKLVLENYAQKMGFDYTFFEEQESTRKTRPIQYDLYQRLQKKEFDALLIYKFDRWARSSQELIGHMETLINKGVSIISYTENIDLNSSMGKAMFTILSAFAQLERDLIRERTIAGLNRAKAWGKVLGRPKGGKDKVKRKTKTPHVKLINTTLENKTL